MRYAMGSMTPAALESDLRALYGAYVFLRAHDLSAVSTTSRLVRAGNLVWLAGRVRDELDELRGAVAGTHGHGQGRDDIVLEAYQSLYWLLLLAVAAGDSFDDVRPHTALVVDGAETTDGEAETTDGATLTQESIAGSWINVDSRGLHDATRRRQALRDGFAVVGQQCRAAQVDVAESVRRDLRELRAKPYLWPYWTERDTAAKRVEAGTHDRIDTP